jgi:hypothetical protein
MNATKRPSALIAGLKLNRRCLIAGGINADALGATASDGAFRSFAE